MAVAVLLVVATALEVGAGDGMPITSVTTIRTPALPSGPYFFGGDTISYGVGDNVRITGAVSSGLVLARSAVSKPNITINRKDNLTVVGERLTFFYPGTVSGGSTVNVEGDEALSMEQAMNDDYITSGGLDVFLNVDRGVEKANNIERIDFLVPSGITMPTTAALLNEVGTIANEKHGNNTYKIALVTSLDMQGRPASYGLLRTVQGNVDYGNVGRPQDSTGNNLVNLYLRNGEMPVGADNGPVEYIRSDTNFIGLSFISFGALGASPGQLVYGYSLFPNDAFDTSDLVSLTDASLVTSGSVNGGDIYGGTFAIFATAAAEAETSEGPAVPVLNIVKSVVLRDSSPVLEHALLGNDVIYTITVTNTGNASPELNGVLLKDELPAKLAFFFGDMDESGPESNAVIFTDSNSGLTFDYATDVRFANSSSPPATFDDCQYPGVAGYDPVIRYLCIRPTGTMAFDPGSPSFSVSFRARIR